MVAFFFFLANLQTSVGRSFRIFLDNKYVGTNFRSREGEGCVEGLTSPQWMDSLRKRIRKLRYSN